VAYQLVSSFVILTVLEDDTQDKGNTKTVPAAPYFDFPFRDDLKNWPHPDSQPDDLRYGLNHSCNKDTHQMAVIPLQISCNV